MCKTLADRASSFLLLLVGFLWLPSCSGRIAGKETAHNTFRILFGQIAIFFPLVWLFSSSTRLLSLLRSLWSSYSNEYKGSRFDNLLSNIWQFQSPPRWAVWSLDVSWLVLQPTRYSSLQYHFLVSLHSWWLHWAQLGLAGNMQCLPYH